MYLTGGRYNLTDLITPEKPVDICIDDLSGADIAAFLNAHLEFTRETTPPESIHALNLYELRRPEITFWAAREGSVLMGCGALKAMGGRRGEIKSMRTDPQHRRKGVARAVLGTIIAEARRRGYTRLYLETGSQPAYEPARRLYASLGFVECPPFEGYEDDPNSVYMTMELS